MKLLLDENVDARLKEYLTNQGHDVTRIGTEHPARLSDRGVLSIAQNEGRVLITNDLDFGGLVFRLRQPHQGVHPSAPWYLRALASHCGARRGRPPPAAGGPRSIPSSAIASSRNAAASTVSVVS